MSGTVDVRPAFRPGSPASIADSAFEVCRRAPSTLLALSALANVPLLAAIAGLLVFVRDRGLYWGSPAYFVELGAISIAVALGAFLRAIGTGALAHAATRALAGAPASAAASLGAALRRGATLAVVTAVRLGAVVLGLLACVVPGILALGALALAPHAVVLEDAPVLPALLRAARLGPRAARGTLAATFLSVAGFFVATLDLFLFLQLGMFLLGAVAPALPTGWLARPETVWLVLVAAKVAVDPLVSAATALAWVDARIRGEGLDLELRSQLLAGETLSIDPMRGAA